MSSEPDAPSTQLAPAAAPPPERVGLTAEHLALFPDGPERRQWMTALVNAEIARKLYAIDRAYAKDFALSGVFDDIKGSTPEQAIATAMVKISIGRAWGFNHSDAMRHIFFNNGKPNIEQALIASKLHQAGYRWDTEFLHTEVTHKGRQYKKVIGCRIWPKEWSSAEQKHLPMLDREGKPVSVEFTEYDADNAMVWDKGKEIPLSAKWNYKSWASDMFYWRALSRFKKFHAPHVLSGVLTRDEASELHPPEHMPQIAAPASTDGVVDAEILEDEPAEAPRKRPTARERVMSQPSFLDVEEEKGDETKT